jgi:hypothetical protein
MKGGLTLEAALHRSLSRYGMLNVPFVKVPMKL